MGMVSTTKSYIVSAACPMPVTPHEKFGLATFHRLQWLCGGFTFSRRYSLPRCG